MNPNAQEDHLFETETMAELCARQGRVGEAIAIFRRLLDMPVEPARRARWRARLDTLESSWAPLREAEVPPHDVPLPPSPGVAVHLADEQITVAWALPPGVESPAIDVLLIQRTPAGIETTKRTINVEAPTGRLGLAASGLHSAVAAAGLIANGRFVPLARSARK